jgi:peptidylprolyl isomerase
MMAENYHLSGDLLIQCQRKNIMSQANKGDTVKVDCTVALQDGKVFKLNNKGPVEFTIGHGLVISGLEKAVIGMNEGEQKSVIVSPEDAYGPHKIELVSRVDRSKVKDDVELCVGMKLLARTNQGIVKDVTVVDISDDEITVDANHFLAGEKLDMKLKLLEIS